MHEFLHMKSIIFRNYRRKKTFQCWWDLVSNLSRPRSTVDDCLRSLIQALLSHLRNQSIFIRFPDWNRMRHVKMRWMDSGVLTQRWARFSCSAKWSQTIFSMNIFSMKDQKRHRFSLKILATHQELQQSSIMISWRMT